MNSAKENRVGEAGETGAARSNTGLTVVVKGGELRISIGVNVLAHAVTYSDWANPFDETADDYIRTFAIEDAEQFAKDVRAMMVEEREDGSSRLSDFIDKACEAAVDDGSLGLSVEDHRIPHGQTAECEQSWTPKAGA